MGSGISGARRLTQWQASSAMLGVLCRSGGPGGGGVLRATFTAPASNVSRAEKSGVEALAEIPRIVPGNPTVPPQVHYSQAQALGKGPIVNARVRPWYWGWNHNREGRDFVAGTTVPQKAQAQGVNTPGGAAQSPRPRWTKVMQTPAYRTTPTTLKPTGPNNG